MEWSRVMDFFSGMEQMTWSGIGTIDAALEVFLGPVFCCLGEVLDVSTVH